MTTLPRSSRRDATSFRRSVTAQYMSLRWEESIKPSHHSPMDIVIIKLFPPALSFHFPS